MIECFQIHHVQLGNICHRCQCHAMQRNRQPPSILLLILRRDIFCDFIAKRKYVYNKAEKILLGVTVKISSPVIGNLLLKISLQARWLIPFSALFLAAAEGDQGTAGVHTDSDDDCLLCSLSPTPSPSLFLPRKRRRGEERECGRKPSWLRLRVGREKGEGGREAGCPPFFLCHFFAPLFPLGRKEGAGKKEGGKRHALATTSLLLALLSGGGVEDAIRLLLLS